MFVRHSTGNQGHRADIPAIFLRAECISSWKESLSAGTEIDFTLTLPAEITRGTEVFVRAHGRVVRVDRKPDDARDLSGVAAIIERYDIIRGEAARVY